MRFALDTMALFETGPVLNRSPESNNASLSYPMALQCEHCGAPMRLLTDVPEVGTGRGMRYYACSQCDNINMRPIDWQREHLGAKKLSAEPVERDRDDKLAWARISRSRSDSRNLFRCCVVLCLHWGSLKREGEAELNAHSGVICPMPQVASSLLSQFQLAASELRRDRTDLDARVKRLEKMCAQTDLLLAESKERISHSLTLIKAAPNLVPEPEPALSGIDRLWHSANMAVTNDAGKLVVAHEPNRASGGKRTEMEVDSFLAVDHYGPEHEALLALILHQSTS